MSRIKKLSWAIGFWVFFLLLVVVNWPHRFELTSLVKATAESNLPLVTFVSSVYPSQEKSKGKLGPFQCGGVKAVKGRPELQLKLLAKGFRALTDLAFAPDDSQRLFVLEQNTGKVWILRGGKRGKHPFLSIRKLISPGGERGMLGIAFHPKYTKNRKFYLYYTDRRGSVVVSEFRTTQNPDRADPGTMRQIIRVRQPEGNHNGGGLRFGPDGYLYIALGDGGGGNDEHGKIGNGQKRNSWLGKILRLDVNRHSKKKAYAIPPDNPWVGNSKFLPEIAFWGLRNPWRIEFDALTGDLWIGDVGQNRAEEINFAPKGVLGLNFGWRCKEGILRHAKDSHCATTKSIPPVAHLKQRGRKVSFCSVIQGFRYRGCKMPGYHDTLFYSDYCIDHLRSFRWSGRKGREEKRVTTKPVYRVTSFAQDHQGELYVSTGTGKVFKLIPRKP